MEKGLDIPNPFLIFVPSNKNIMSKSNLTNAFKALRKKGYFARQNFWCCQSCAWASIPDAKAEKAVFYHRQDANDLKENGSCYLAWNGNGKEIVEVLEQHGVSVNWRGSIDSRIKISI